MNGMSNNQSNSSLTDGLELGEILHVLWASKWVILLVTTITLSISALYTLQQIPQYQSNILLQVDSRSPGLGQTGSAIQQMFLGGGAGSDSAMTQIALIRSSFVLDPVIEKLGLKIKVSYHPATWMSRIFPKKARVPVIEHIKVPYELLNKKLRLFIESPTQAVLYNQAREEMLRGTIGETLISKNKTTELRVQNPPPAIGLEYDVVVRSSEKVIQSLLKSMTIEEAGSKLHQSTGVLDIALKGDNPRKIVNILNTIARVTREKDAEKKAQEAAQTLDFLYKQLPITKKLLESAEKTLNLYRAKSGKIDIKLQTQFLLNQLADLAKDQSELQVKKLEMLQQYTNAHPLMIALNEQTNALKSQEVELLKELKRLPASDQVAVNLMRDVKVKQSIYLVLLRKIQELQVLKAGTVSGVRILSYAKMPDSPLPSKNFIIYTIGTLLGFIMSVGYIFMRKMLFPRVTDPHWLEQKFSIPNFAIIPYSKIQVNTSLEGRTALIAHENPRDLAVESIRSLRTSLQVNLACAHNNLVSILGICPGVGKSFISVNLAYLSAAGGKRVLVVDGDLRRGTVHKYFQKSPKPGFSDVLMQESPLKEAIRQSVEHHNLYYLPRGDYPKNPSELLMSEQLKLFIDKVSKEFDLVIFDTAPVLLVTDALLISQYVATNYLMVGAGVHRPGEIELTIKQLSGSNIQVQGTIFNFHREVSKDNYYYYGKYYYYRNSYYNDEVKKEKI